MTREIEIDGLLYSLDAEEMVATVEKCVDKEYTEVNIPDSFFYEGIVYEVTSIGSRAFSGCSSLTAITIPKGVTYIGGSAFLNSGITYLTILGKPTIDEQAFDSCKNLTDIYCYSEDVPHAKGPCYSFGAFGSLDLSRITLHVPENAIEAYKKTEPWCGFGTIVTIK